MKLLCVLNKIGACKCALSSTRQILVTPVITYLTRSLAGKYRMLMPWATCHSRTQIIWCHRHSSFWCLKIWNLSNLLVRGDKISKLTAQFLCTHYLKPGAQEVAPGNEERGGEKRWEEGKGEESGVRDRREGEREKLTTNYQW